MDPERQRAIASQGGRAAHASGNAHEFTSEEARAAGARSHMGQHQQGSGGRRQKQQDRQQQQQQQQHDNRRKPAGDTKKPQQE